MNGCNNNVTYREILQRVELEAAKGRPQQEVDVIVGTCRELITGNGYELSDALDPDFVNRLSCLIEVDGLKLVPGIVLPKISSEALMTALGAFLSICKPTDPQPNFNANSQITTPPPATGPRSPIAPTPKESTPLQIVYKGEWLTVWRESEINGLDYKICGEMPVFQGITPMELYSVLVRNERPDFSALRFETQEEACAMLRKIEAQYDYLRHKAPVETRETNLTAEQLRASERLVAVLRPFERDHPDFINEAADLYMHIYGNELVIIGLQQVVALMIQERGIEVSKDRPQRWQWAVNTMCETYGYHIGDYNSQGDPVKNMPVGAVTRSRLEALKEKLGRKAARKCVSCLRPVLKFAKDKGFIRENPAVKLKVPPVRAEREAKAAEEIAIDTPAQVQIALNVAAQHRNGYFLPHVVLIYFAFLRPESELLWITPRYIQLASRVIRFMSRKVMSRCIIHLSENAAAILEWCWDGGPLKFDGWEEFLEMMRAAQGRAAVPPSWFAKQLPISSTFRKGDIANLKALTTMLSRQSLPFYKFLRQQVGAKFDQPLAEYCATGAGAQELETRILEGFNELVQGPSLAGNPAFADIRCRPETIELQKAAPQGAELRRQNRLMLEDACPEFEQSAREVPDRPRHTGKSVYVWIRDWARDTFLDDKSFKIFQINYNGLILKQRAAVYLSLLPASMPEIKKTAAKDAILKQLVEFDFVQDGKLPETPDVPTFNAQRPVKELWLPKVSDAELEKTMFEIGVRATAKRYGTTYPQLSAVCAAKRLRVPPCGRNRTCNPADVPVPPPLVTLTNQQLEDKIRKLHGLTAAARELGINWLALKVYCYLNKIAIPSARKLGSWRGKLARVKLSPQQIKALLARGKTLEEIAQLAGDGITVEHLRRYCAKRGIKIPDEPVQAQAKSDLEAVKAAVGHELSNLDRDKLTSADVLDLVLSQAPFGLSEPDIIAVLEANGVPFTVEKIRTAISCEGNGSFAHFDGVLHLMKREAAIDLDNLKTELLPIIQGKTGWGPLEAIRCLLSQAKQGLSIPQLATGLSWFGFQTTEDRLTKDIRNYVNQVRLQMYRGVVTLPETSPSFTIGGPEKESTPNLAELTSAICERYADLVDKDLTNVEMMEFVLSQAPNGLWTDEFLAITKKLGLHFKENCIHWAASYEAKDCFRRHNGRLTFLQSCAPRVTWRDVQLAIDRKVEFDSDLTAEDLMLDILACFPKGLLLREWHAIAQRIGLKGKLGPFRMRAYRLGRKGRCSIKNGRALTASLPVAGEDDSSGSSGQ
jgi:hypothetical protein